MNSKNQNKDKEYHNKYRTNTDKEHYARHTIFKALSDGQWHRNMELKQTTKLSSATLTKDLDQMVKIQMIEKKIDTESGKYPRPVFYKAGLELIQYMHNSMRREKFSDNVETVLEESKDPLIILDAIHNINQVYFIEILELIQENKNITWGRINFIVECFIWWNYQHFIMELIEATGKIINEIDINKLLISQANRQKEFWETVIKHYEEANTHSPTEL